MKKIVEKRAEKNALRPPRKLVKVAENVEPNYRTKIGLGKEYLRKSKQSAGKVEPRRKQILKNEQIVSNEKKRLEKFENSHKKNVKMPK